MRVLVFGASITQGFWDSEGGWANRLRKHYDQLQIQDLRNNKYPTVFGLGISGESTSGLLKRFEHEVQARIWPNEEVVFIFSIGTNNARVQDGVRQSSADDYESDLRQLVAVTQRYSKKMLMVGLPPCDENLTQPVAWNSNVSYANADIKEIDDTMRKVCVEHSIPYIHTFSPIKERLVSGDKLLADGLHPNDNGHKLMFDLILPEFEKYVHW